MKTSLKHRTLSAQIVGQLRQAILDGSYVAGTQLRQDALAEAYGVSRIPVREALFQLEAEGLLSMVPHKGAIVSGLSLDEINDVFDLRGLLEPRLLAASIPRLTAGDFDRLEQIQQRFTQSIAARSVNEWGALNAEFHLALYAGSRQPRTRSIVAGLLQTSERYTRLQLSNALAMHRAETEHAELIRLARAGEGTAACRLLVGHVEAVRQDLLQVVGRTLARGDP